MSRQKPSEEGNMGCMAKAGDGTGCPSTGRRGSDSRRDQQDSLVDIKAFAAKLDVPSSTSGSRVPRSERRKPTPRTSSSDLLTHGGAQTPIQSNTCGG